MKLRLGIAPKLTFIFVLFAAVSLAGLGTLAYLSGQDALRQAAVLELQAIAAEKESALIQWKQDKLAVVAANAALPGVRESLTTLRSAAADSLEARAAHDQLVDHLRPWADPAEGFLRWLVIDPDTAEVIAATSADEERKFKETFPYFIYGRQASYLQSAYYSLELQDVAMTASAPVKAADGRLLGVLAGRLNLNQLNAIMQRRTGLRQTDDTFLVNTSNLFVTQPRFISDPAVLRRGVHTEAVKRCLTRDSGVILANDYRGVPAIVVYRWLSDFNLCLIVKLDQSEALGPSRAFGQTVFLLSLTALVVASALAIGLARTITRPVQSLQAGVVRFGRGDLGVRLPETSADELGVLAHEFNKMAETLAEEQTHLRRRAEQFFNLALDMLCTLNFNGHLVDTNSAWEPTLGYGREELQAHPVVDFIHPDDVAQTTAALRHVSQDSTLVRFENRWRHKVGSYRWLSWVVVVSPQDQLLYAAARDVTERRQAEETLQQQAEELARSNKELEQFAYVASHDLQEPLRIISSYVQLLARRYRGRLDQEADEFIGFAVEGANRMKTLINDLLAFSRVGTRGKEFAAVDMEAIFERAIGDLALAIEESRTTVTHDPLPHVLADDTQMTQLLQNLIANAIKFHGPELPLVHVGAWRQEDQWLLFVRDNGIGIDPQYNERIFILFQRLHHRDEYPGTGIGLAICRKIVERHGGRIWVESAPGQGATFYFTLRPVAGEPPAEPAPKATIKRAKDSLAERAADLV